MAVTIDLNGAACLVTGAARGIGRELSRALAAAGGVVAVGDVDVGGVRETAGDIATGGGRAMAVALDVTDPASVAAAVAEAASFGGGRLDVLVNNAGVNAAKPADQITLGEWQRVMAVNLTGVFLCAQAAARTMRNHGGGRIVNIASIYGLVGPVLHATAAYAASKGGVISLTRALAVEWAGDGIRVNAIAPTHVRTEMTRARIDDPGYQARLLDRTPLRHVLEPSDLNGALLFLASEASAWVTGHVLAVDGGWLAE